MISPGALNPPEYPQSPVVHLNRPTAINIRGRLIHSDKPFLAGQSNAARVKAGLVGLFVDSSMTDPLRLPAVP